MINYLILGIVLSSLGLVHAQDRSTTVTLDPGTISLEDLDWEVIDDSPRISPFATEGQGYIGPTAAAGDPVDPIQPTANLSFGGWSDSVEFDIPPGPNGHAPRLSVVANHNVRHGELGVGHSLVASSRIERRGLSGGVPNLQASTQYLLDGQRISETNGVWRVEDIDARALQFIAIDNVWILETPNGHRRTYGTRVTGPRDKSQSTGINATKLLYRAQGRSFTDSEGGNHNSLNIDPAYLDCPRTNTQCNTVTWYLSQDEDPSGNIIYYDYEVAPLRDSTVAAGQYWYPDSNHHRLKQIRYDRAVVEFEYEQRGDARIDLSSGAPTFIGDRLRRIRASRNDQFHSLFAFDYLDEQIDGECAAGINTPGLSVLRRIRRLSDPDSGRQRQRLIRCYTTDNVTTESWRDPVSIPVDSSSIGFDFSAFSGFEPGSSEPWDADVDRLLPIVTNLNFDGRPDLLVINLHCPTASNALCSVAMDAKVATHSGQFRADALADRWLVEYQKRLSGELFTEKRGYVLLDLNRDGMSELLWETPSGVNKMLRYDPASDTFVVANLQVTGRALREAQFADINGDGHVDWIDVVNERYLLNSGSGAYFIDTGVRQTSLWRTLALPLAQIELSSALQPPKHLKNAWSTNGNLFLKEQMKFSDVNSDGIADITLAVFSKWDNQGGCLGTECRTRPDPQSSYSRIFWGDGYGQFIESGLSAGPPTLIEVPKGASEPGGILDTRTRSWSVPFSVRDFDRSGVSSLVGAHTPNPAGGAMSLRATRFRNLLEGYRFETVNYSIEANFEDGPAQRLEYAIESPGEIDLKLPVSGAGDCCHPWGVFTAIADFDGNGFSDLIRFQTGTEAQCGTPICASIALNRRSTSRARVLSMSNSWGGDTQLKWGFSAQAKHPNPTLPQNIELLTSVDGEQGLVEHRYGYGAFAHGRFNGFALVQRQGLRGGVDEFGYNVSSALAHKALYKARFRQNGSLERATAYVHGHSGENNELVIETGASFNRSIGPRFNPLIRQCDFEFGASHEATVQSQLAQVLVDCFSFNRSDERQPSLATILAASGSWRFPPLTIGAFTSSSLEPWRVASAVWGDSGEPENLISLSNLDQPGAVGYAMSALTPVYGEVGYWQPDTLIFAPVTPSRSSAPLPKLAQIQHQGDSNADVTLHIRDVAWDRSLFHTVRVTDERDVLSTQDNLTTAYTYEPVADYFAAHRLIQTTTNRRVGSGIQLARVKSVHYGPFKSGAFALPLEINRCGSISTDCQLETVQWHDNGMIHTRTQGGRTERWSFNDWCSERFHWNALGELRTTILDSSCRTTRQTFLGLTSTYEYDGFGRLLRSSQDPGGGLKPEIRLYRWSDDPIVSQDPPFTAPRKAISDGNGKLELFYYDGFGRTTRRETCVQRRARVALGVQCDTEHKTLIAWQGFGEDGLLKALAPPYFIGEDSVATELLRDGLGRIVVRRAPSATSMPDDPEWVDWYSWPVPHGSIDVSPTGVQTQTHWTTLGSTVLKGDLLHSEQSWNVLGEPVQTDDAGLKSQFSYDSLHRLESVNRTDTVDCVAPDDSLNSCNHRLSFTYTETGELASVTRPDKSRLTWTYDDLGRVLSEQLFDAQGAWIAELQSNDYTLTADEQWRTITKSNRAGASTSYTHDALGRLVSAQQPEYNRQLSRVYSQDGGGNRSQATRVVTDSQVESWQTHFDVFNHVNTRTSPNQGTVQYRHNGWGQLLSLTDADGVSFGWGYAADGSLTSKRRGPWQTESIAYRTDGFPLVKRFNGHVEHYAYDALGRLVRISEGIRAEAGESPTTRQLGYEGSSQRITNMSLQRSSDKASQWQYEYDAWQRVRQISGPYSRIRIERDVLGRPRIHEDAEGYQQLTRYDAEGRTVYSEDKGRNAYAISHRFEDAYSYLSHDKTVPYTLMSTTVDAAGAQTLSWRDALGRLLAIQRPDGTRLENLFNADLRVSSTILDTNNQPRRSMIWEYDPLSGRVMSETGPFDPSADDEPAETGPVTRYAWSAAGRLSRVDASGEVTTREYQHGLIKREKWFDLEKRYEYAASDAGVGARLVSILERGTGPIRRTDFEFDQSGRLIRTGTRSPGRSVVRELSDFTVFGKPRLLRAITTDSQGSDTVQSYREYDAEGRRTLQQLSINNQTQGTSTWSYYANGMLMQSLSPSNHRITYDYGPNFDYELDVIREGDSDLVTIIDRDEAGRVLTVKSPFSRKSMTYDVNGRLATQTLSGEQTSSWQGAYDTVGQLVSEAMKLNGHSWQNDYRYNGAGHLISEFNGLDESTYSYKLSSSGKRLSTSVQTATHPATTTEFTYTGEHLRAVDDQTLAYDHWGAVVSDQHGNTFNRDAKGYVRRIKSESGVKRLLRDANNIPVALADAEGLQVTHWGLDVSAAPLEVRHPSGTSTGYVAAAGTLYRSLTPTPGFTEVAQDALEKNLAGSVVLENGKSVDPGTAFGVGQQPPSTDVFAYAGMQSLSGIDDVYMARHRFYDAQSGRFLSPDPIGLAGDKHRMLYANANPVRYSDPLGLSAVCEDPVSLLNVDIRPFNLTINTEFVEPPANTELLDDISEDYISQWSGFNPFENNFVLPGEGCGYAGCGPAGADSNSASFSIGGKKSTGAQDDQAELIYLDADEARDARADGKNVILLFADEVPIDPELVEDLQQRTGESDVEQDIFDTGYFAIYKEKRKASRPTFQWVKNLLKGPGRSNGNDYQRPQLGPDLSTKTDYSSLKTPSSYAGLTDLGHGQAEQLQWDYQPFNPVWPEPTQTLQRTNQTKTGGGVPETGYSLMDDSGPDTSESDNPYSIDDPGYVERFVSGAKQVVEIVKPLTDVLSLAPKGPADVIELYTEPWYIFTDGINDAANRAAVSAGVDPEEYSQALREERAQTSEEIQAKTEDLRLGWVDDLDATLDSGLDAVVETYGAVTNKLYQFGSSIKDRVVGSE